MVPFEQISLDNESSPIISNPNVANHEISDYFFENLGQLDEKNVLYYGHLAEGFVGVDETTLTYWKENQEYVLLSDIRTSSNVRLRCCNPMKNTHILRVCSAF